MGQIVFALGNSVVKEARHALDALGSFGCKISKINRTAQRKSLSCKKYGDFVSSRGFIRPAPTVFL